MEPIDAIGWTASFILVLTVSRQVWKQWRERSTEGVSHWLFIGQMAASACFLVYSWLLGNMVFAVSNALLLFAAVAGQVLYIRNRRSEAAGRSS